MSSCYVKTPEGHRNISVIPEPPQYHSEFYTTVQT